MISAVAADTRLDQALARFAEIARARYGLAHSARVPEVLSNRLITAMAHVNEADPLRFVQELDQSREDSDLSLAVASALPNHETYFFRDMDQLQNAVSLLPQLTFAEQGPVRILSAGCSSGEEAYSLAMLLVDALHLLWGRPVEIVGMDVCPRSIAAARLGRYRAAELRRAGYGVFGWKDRFLRSEGEDVVVRDFLRRWCSFRRANLLTPESTEALGKFDLVLCRNVLIYFDPSSADRALATLETLVRPGGALVMGSAEASVASRPQLRSSWAGEFLWFERAAVSG